MTFSWDSKALRFRGSDGRFVKREAISQAIERSIQETSSRLKQVSERLQSGQINLAQWTLEARDIIKAQHLLSAGIAQGGKAQLSPAALGRIGAITKQQYAYLANFSREIERGLPMGKKFINRIQLYAEAAHGTFVEAERRMKADAGFDEEMNVLSAKESCAGCSAEASKGWVAIGTLSRVGSRDCLARCKCAIQTRRAA